MPVQFRYIGDWAAVFLGWIVGFLVGLLVPMRLWSRQQAYAGYPIVVALALAWTLAALFFYIWKRAGDKA